MMKASAILVAVLVVTPAPLFACAVCFGDPNSSATQGLNSGIIVLLVLSGVVLGAIGSFIFYLFKRSKLFIINGPEDLGVRLMEKVKATHD